MEHENCRHLLSSLSDYVDGVLESQLCAELERHLQDCENCQIVVDSLRKTVYLYRTTASQTTLPKDVRQRLYCRLDLEDFLRLP